MDLPREFEHEAFISLPLSEYFEKANVNLLLDDLIEEAIRADAADISSFASEYFARGRRPGGEQLVKKPFAFVSASLHNKKSFIQLAERGLVGFKTTFQEVTQQEFFALLEYLCPTFPESVIGAAAASVQPSGEGRYSFRDISTATYIELLFGDWLNQHSEINGPRVEPTSQPISQWLSQLSYQHPSTFIPRSIVEQAFEYSSKDASVTFADFKRTLVQFLVNGTDFVSRFCDLSSPTPSPAPEAATEPAAETADANSSSSSSENER